MKKQLQNNNLSFDGLIYFFVLKELLLKNLLVLFSFLCLHTFEDYSIKFPVYQKMVRKSH